MFKFVGDAILETTLIVVLFGSVLALAFGALLIMDSARALRINARMGRWVSTRTWGRPLDISRNIDWKIYGHHRLVGIAVVLWTAYVLYVLTTRYRLEPVLFALQGLVGSRIVLEWVVESAYIVLLAGNVLILIGAMILIVRPAAIKALESWANRNYSGREAMKPFETVHDSPDQFVYRQPSLTGWLMVLASFYVLLTLAFVYLGRMPH
ncbi:MAG: hypothetical protein AABM33_03730 [Pseudomonadota bacterium]